MKNEIKTLLNISIIIVVVFNLCLPAFSIETVQINNPDAEQKAADLESAAQKSGLQWNRAAAQDAIKSYTNAAEIWIKLNKKNKAAVCFRNAGNLSIILGFRENASKFFNKAISLLEDTDFSDEKSRNYSELSVLELHSGQIEKSENYFKKALLFAEKAKSQSAKASALFSAAEYYYARNNLTHSLDSYKNAIELWKEVKDVKQEANTLLNLAYLYLKQNEYSTGFDALNSALAKWQEVGDLRGQAFTYKAIGRFYNEINEKQKALDSFQKAEKLFADDLDYAEKASLFNGIAIVYESFGEWKLAMNYRIRAFELFQKEDHLYGQLATLPDLAQLSYLTEDFSSSENYLLKGEKLASKIKDNFYLALVYEQFGNLYLKKEEFEKSLAYFQKSLSSFQAKSQKRQTSRVLKKIGQIYENQNDIAAARKYFLESLELNKQVKDKFDEADTLYHLARLDHLENKEENALFSMQSSIDVTESFYTDIINSKLKSTYISNVFDRYELYINLLIKKHNKLPNENYAVQALQTAEKSRARSMLENLSLTEADFTKDASPEIVKREKEIRVLLNSKADKLTDLLSNNADKAETEKLDNEINELEHELEEIKATLKQNSPIYSAIKNPAPFDVAGFQRDILDENSLLLEFSFGKEESYLWLVGKTEINSYILPPREQIESHIEKLRESLASREMRQGESVENYQARVSEAEDIYKYESKQLSDKLFGQIADRLSNKRLIIVPDGKLHYFPIAALPFPNSTDNLPILLTNETIYEPSAATLALLMRNGKKISAAPKNLLVFSDPIFSNQDARIVATADIKDETRPEIGLLRAEKFRLAESLASLVRLNASQDEADAIMQIIGDSESIALSGAAATRERALDASIADYKIIHFATHGFIKEERPELSGIVLSQVDEAGQSRNGVVRLQDIYAMNLLADAVVLSACNTGIGKEVKGEGLLSLNNAFLQTGAKSVVSSLWKVEDYAARELMKNFYRELTSGTVTTAEALRRAQIKLRQNPQYKSPFYWAAFTVQGDFQTAPQLAAGFDYRLYGLLVLPFALVLTYIYRRRLKLFNRKLINKN